MTTTTFIMRSVVLVILILISFMDWRVALMREKIIKSKTEQVTADEQLIEVYKRTIASLKENVEIRKQKMGY